MSRYPARRDSRADERYCSTCCRWTLHVPLESHASYNEPGDRVAYYCSECDEEAAEAVKEATP